MPITVNDALSNLAQAAGLATEEGPTEAAPVPRDEEPKASAAAPKPEASASEDGQLFTARQRRSLLPSHPDLGEGDVLFPEYEAYQTPLLGVKVELVDGARIASGADLSTPTVMLTQTLHPNVRRMLLAAQYDQRGPRAGQQGSHGLTWSISTGEHAGTRLLTELLRTVHPGQGYADGTAFQASGKLSSGDRWRANRTLLRTTADARLDGLQTGGVTAATHPMDTVARYVTFPVEKGFFTLKGLEGRVSFKAFTGPATPEPGVLDEWALPPNFTMDHRPDMKAAYREPFAIRGPQAVNMIDWLKSREIYCYDLFGGRLIERLDEVVSRSAIVFPAPGRPAQASTCIGRSKHALVSGEEFEGPVAIKLRDSHEIAKLDRDENWFIDPRVLDAVAMAGVAPSDDPVLLEHQRLLVARHAQTEWGMVNSLSTGLGKTCATLRAIAARWLAGKSQFSIVVVEANVREQWEREAARFFPEARVITITASRQGAELRDALLDDDPRPLLVIISYALVGKCADAEPYELGNPQRQYEPGEQMSLLAAPAPTVEEQTDLSRLLVSVRWHDLIADEAMGLRGAGNTLLKRSLWRLRDVSDVAVALTATPLRKSLDDIGALLSWARNDRSMFHGVRLSKVFADLADPEVLADLWGAMGALLFRMDKSEVDVSDLPSIITKVVQLEPSPAERRVADAAANELKAAYEELVAQVEMLEQLDPDDPELPKVREELRAARQYVLMGASDNARICASDPEALLMRDNPAAKLIEAFGDIHEAVEAGGTKRKWAVEYILDAKSRDEQVLVFTSFPTVAELLREQLEQHNLEVSVVSGAGAGRRRAEDVRKFQDGEADVLIGTRAAERGLNLQVAKHVIHLDMDWVADSAMQRTGRAERVGAKHEQIHVVYPRMKGTIEEIVASRVVARAASAAQVLDVGRGVKAADTDTGRSFGDLIGSVNGAGLAQGQMAIIEALASEMSVAA